MSGTAKDRGIREVRPGVFELRVSLGLNPATGKYESKSEMFEGTLTGARKARARLLASVGGPGVRAGLGDRTVDDAIAAFMETLPLNGRTRKTQVTYQDRLAHLSRAYGKLPLKTLSTERITDLYTALGTMMTGNSVVNVHKTISAMLNWCAKPPRHWVDGNPAFHTERPAEVTGHITFPTVAQLKAIITYARASKNSDNASVFRFTADTGLRLGEVTALRWESVDLERGRVWVRASMDKTFEKDTKTHKDRTVSLSTDTIAGLREHRTIMEKRAADFGVEIDPRAFVWSFEPDSSEPRSPTGISMGFRNAARATGYSGSFHTLRHFMVTQWLLAGRPPIEVANRAGHSIQVMLKVYAHWIDGGDQAGADAMGGLLND